MPLWGATDADESKPKWLTTAQKKEVFANTTGWVVEAGSTIGWDRFVGSEGKMIGVDRFGFSAPGKIVMDELGFSEENIINVCKSIL